MEITGASSVCGALDKMKIISEQTNITPSEAGKILQKNQTNRPLKMAWAREIGNEMKAGRFVLNGEPIIVSDTGALLDGQHRLKGCVYADTAFDTLLVKGISDSAFNTIDCGAKRSMGDVLSIMGEKHGTDLASSLKLIDKIVKKSLGTGGASFGTHKNYDAHKLLEEYPKTRASVEFIKGLKRPIGVPQACLIAGHYLCSEATSNREQPAAFFRTVCTGVGAEALAPAFQYRELIARRYAKGDRLGRYFIMSGMFKAWNLMREGKTVKQLSFPCEGQPEKLPMPK